MMKRQEYRILIVWVEDDNSLKSKVIRQLDKSKVADILNDSLANPFVEYCVVSDNKGNAKKYFQTPQMIESRSIIKKRKPKFTNNVPINRYTIELFIKHKIRSGKLLAARKYNGKWYLLKPEMALCLVDVKCLVPVQWKMAFWYDENCQFLPCVLHKGNV